MTKETRDIHLPREEILKQKRTIAVVGATSNLVGRMITPAFQKISTQYPKVNFLPLSRDPARHPNLLLPIHESGWQSTDRFIKAFQEGSEPVIINGAILAIPTNVHLPLARIFAERDIPVWVEKPICLPSQVEETRELQRQHPNLVFAADFFMDSPAFTTTLRQLDQLMPIIGQLTRIDGRLIENWPLEKGREWLLDKGTNGGGLGMDVLVHVVALIDQTLKRLNVTDHLRVLEAQRYRYVDRNNPLPEGEESYMWARAKAGGIPIYFDGGKGTGDHYYGMTITGQEGSIEIFTGTDGEDRCCPYVQIKQPGNHQCQVIPDGGLGYKDLIREFMTLVYGISNTNGNYSLQDRADRTLSAVETMRDAYTVAGANFRSHPLGTTPNVPCPVIGTVSEKARGYLFNGFTPHE